MQKIPAVGFSAFSGTGKTTLLERLIVCLKQESLRLAVVKHDAHDFTIDHPGKDSWRFAQAGADAVLISSGAKTALIEQRPRTFEENLAALRDVDLILVEGYKQQDLPRVGLCRKATGKGLPCDAAAYIALVTDDEALRARSAVTCFGFEDAAPLAEFLLRYTGLRR